MTEVSTPKNSNPEQNDPIDKKTQKLQEKLKARQEKLAKAAGRAVNPEKNETNGSQEPTLESTSYKGLSADERQDLAEGGKDERHHSRRKILGMLAGGVVLATGVGAGVYAVTRPKKPVVAIPSVEAPTTGPAPGETPSPTPAETETQPTLESDQPVAERYLDYSIEKFNKLSLEEAMLAISYHELTQPATWLQFDGTADGKGTDGVHRNKDGKNIVEKSPYAGNQNLYDFSPAVRAANPDYAGAALDPQGILDTITFERANVGSQSVDQAEFDERKQDEDMTARMIRGLYYDPESVFAQRFLNSELNRGRIHPKYIGGEPGTNDRPKYTKMSDTNLTTDLGNGQIEYFIMNYFDPTASLDDDFKGNRWVAVTPFDSEINLEDPYMIQPGVISIKNIRHYLIIDEGFGSKDPNENLY